MASASTLIPAKQSTYSSSLRYSFNIPRIKNLTANPLKYKPAVNQVELSYWNPQPELLEWCKENGLLLEAYSPLGSNKQVKETLQLPEVQAVAKELNITAAQAIISWHVQRGVRIPCMSANAPRAEQCLSRLSSCRRVSLLRESRKIYTVGVCLSSSSHVA